MNEHEYRKRSMEIGAEQAARNEAATQAVKEAWGMANAPKLHLADPEDGTLTETRCRDCGQVVYRTITGDGPRYAHRDSKMLFAPCPPSCTVDHGIGAR